MTDMTLFAWLFAQTVPPLTGAVQGVIAALSGWLVGPLRYIIIAFIATMMMKMAFKPSANPLSSLIQYLVACAIGYYGVATAANYNQFVGDLLLHTLPTEITNVVSGATGATIQGSSFDHIWNRAFAAGLDVFHNLPWSIKAVPLGILVIIYWGIAIISIGYGFFIFLIAQIFIALLVSVGVLFVAMFPFPASRSYFWRWVSASLSMVLLQIFVVSLLALLTTTENQILAQISSMNGGLGLNPDGEMGQLKLLLGGGLLFALCATVAKQLPALAVAVAGGVLADVSDIGAMASTAAAMAYRGASTAVSAVSGGSGGSGRGIFSPAGRSLSGGP